MPDQRVDYDQIAPIYDRRYEFNKRSGTADALVSLTQALDARRILEVGCGTARWLMELGPHVEKVCGIDFSLGMLRQARQRDQSFLLVCGRGSQLSFPDGFFDLVFCVNAIHHFDHPRVFVSEAHRLLGPGGALAVIGMEPHGRRDGWYVYHYFDGVYETDLERFPSWGEVADWVVAEGFERVERRPVERFLDHKIGRQVLDDPFLQKNATSQLALLSDEAYSIGLRRIEAALVKAEAAGKTILFPSDVSLAMLTGQARG
jgi:ubiquinone/menaquinone biosynthesis C-methylase UbiE